MKSPAPRIHQEKIAIVVRKYCYCQHCGRRTVLGRTFFQFVGNSNFGTHGRPKTREEILGELVAQSAAWEQEPVACTKCR